MSRLFYFFSWIFFAIEIVVRCRTELSGSLESFKLKSQILALLLSIWILHSAACQIHAINSYMTQINSETDTFSNQIVFWLDKREL